MAPPSKRRRKSRDRRELNKERAQERRAVAATSRAVKSSNTSKAALDANSHVEEHYLGGMDVLCVNCDAQHFRCDMTGGTTNLFSQCCEKGKFVLPAYKQSPLITDLLTDRHNESGNFKRNIRSYNSALAMISSGIQNEEVTGGGPYFLRIHGGIYHNGAIIAEGWCGACILYMLSFTYTTPTKVALLG